MVKFETVVRVFVLGLVLVTQNLAAKEDDKTSQSTTIAGSTDMSACVNYQKMSDAEVLKQARRLSPGKSDTEATRLYVERMCPGQGSSKNEDCSNAESSFNSAKKDFNKACGKANIVQENVGCEIALTQCKCAGKGNDSKEFGSVKCSEVAGAGEEESSSRDSKSSATEKQQMSNFKYCPSKMAGQYDKIKEDKEKAEDKADELEKDLPTKMDDANKAKSEGQEKIDGIDEKIQDAKTAYDKAQLEAKKKMSDDQKAIKTQISQLQQQQAAIDEQISQFDLAAGDAAMKRDETKKQIQLNCHATAATQAAKAMGDYADLVRAGRANVGGQNAMLKRAGTTLDTIFDRRATQIYNKCIASKPTVFSMDSANKVYDAAVKQTETSKANARKRRAQIDDQIKQIKDPAGNCGQVATSADGSTNETDSCRTMREFKEAQVASFNEAQGKNAVLQKQKVTAQQQADQAYNSKMTAYQQAQQQATKQRAKADSLERMLNAADANGTGGSGVDPKDYADANAEFGSTTSAARTLLQCGDVCPQGLNSTSGTCGDAANYLKSFTPPSSLDAIKAANVSKSPQIINATPTGSPHDTAPGVGKAGEPQNNHDGTSNR